MNTTKISRLATLGLTSAVLAFQPATAVADTQVDSTQVALVAFQPTAALSLAPTMMTPDTYGKG